LIELKKLIFWFWLKEVARRDLCSFFLVLLDSSAFLIYNILTFDQKKKKVNPTATPISALVKGNRQMGFQVDRATNIDFFGFG